MALIVTLEQDLFASFVLLNEHVDPQFAITHPLVASDDSDLPT